MLSNLCELVCNLKSALAIEIVDHSHVYCGRVQRVVFPPIVNVEAKTLLSHDSKQLISTGHIDITRWRTPDLVDSLAELVNQGQELLELFIHTARTIHVHYDLVSHSYAPGHTNKEAHTPHVA
jgi:hypothetical protein